jgi:DnaK suppressor protein
MLADVDRSLAVLDGEEQHRDEQIQLSDAGSELSAVDSSTAMRSTMTDQRRQVAAALERIESGSYGRCVDCGTELPPERLEARPEAERCVRCQSKREETR